MTIQEKVKTMRNKLNQLRENANTKEKEWSFGLLHDALLFSRDKLDELPPDSFVGFMELTAHSVREETPDPRAVRRNLQKLGFWIAPMN